MWADSYWPEAFLPTFFDGTSRLAFDITVPVDPAWTFHKGTLVQYWRWTEVK